MTKEITSQNYSRYWKVRNHKGKVFSASELDLTRIAKSLYYDEIKKGNNISRPKTLADLRDFLLKYNDMDAEPLTDDEWEAWVEPDEDSEPDTYTCQGCGIDYDKDEANHEGYNCPECGGML